MPCLPFLINGNPYTADYLGGKMTEGVLTSYYNGGVNYAVITNLDSPWAINLAPIDDIVGDGEITFGVDCGSVIVLNFTSVDTSTLPAYYVLIYAYVDSVPYPSVGVPIAILTEASTSSLGIEIPIIGVCSEITLKSDRSRDIGTEGALDGVCTVNVEVISISDNPSCSTTTAEPPTTTPEPPTTTPEPPTTTPEPPTTTPEPKCCCSCHIEEEEVEIIYPPATLNDLIFTLPGSVTAPPSVMVVVSFDGQSPLTNNINITTTTTMPPRQTTTTIGVKSDDCMCVPSSNCLNF